MKAKIDAANRLIRGWCQYYRVTSSPQDPFSHLRRELFWAMAHWLGRKYQISMPEVMEVPNRQHTRHQNSTTVMPTAFKAKRLRTKPWHNPYTEKEAIIREKFLAYEALWTGKEDRPGWKDLREEVILTKGTTCYVCGTTLHPSAVEIDHVLPRARFKDHMRLIT